MMCRYCIVLLNPYLTIREMCCHRTWFTSPRRKGPTELYRNKRCSLPNEEKSGTVDPSVERRFSSILGVLCSFYIFKSIDRRGTLDLVTILDIWYHWHLLEATQGFNRRESKRPFTHDLLIPKPLVVCTPAHLSIFPKCPKNPDNFRLRTEKSPLPRRASMIVGALYQKPFAIIRRRVLVRKCDRSLIIFRRRNWSSTVVIGRSLLYLNSHLLRVPLDWDVIRSHSRTSNLMAIYFKFNIRLAIPRRAWF